MTHLDQDAAEAFDPRTNRAGGQGGEAGSESGVGGTAETDRDALQPADYGTTGREAPEPGESEGHQGGLSDNESGDSGGEGGGREPVVQRDRDYDPDGDRFTGSDGPSALPADAASVSLRPQP